MFTISSEDKRMVAFRTDINRLRGAAILLVVLSHALIISRGNEVGYAIQSSIRGASWIFTFVSGYLLAHLQDRYTYKSFLLSKIRNVLSPYIAIISAILVVGLARKPPMDFGEVIAVYLLGHPAASPLWFIPMILLMFLGFPLFQHLIGRPRLLLKVALISVVIALLLGRPRFDAGPIINLVYFLSAFLCGIASRIHQEKLKDVSKRYGVAMLMVFLVGIAITLIFDPRKGQLLAMMPLTVFLLAMFGHSGRLDPFWDWLAPRSFGIFFVHGIFTNRFPGWFGYEQNVLFALALGLGLTIACGLFVSLAQTGFGKHSRLLLGS